MTRRFFLCQKVCVLKKWHGGVVILANEHTISAGEMASAFAKEDSLATIVRTETARRLTLDSGFKVGQGYMLVMPKAAYITWVEGTSKDIV
jgi:C-terminal processing protease CtpA/Prc